MSVDLLKKSFKLPVFGGGGMEVIRAIYYFLQVAVPKCVVRSTNPIAVEIEAKNLSTKWGFLIPR